MNAELMNYLRTVNTSVSEMLRTSGLSAADTQALVLLVAAFALLLSLLALRRARRASGVNVQRLNEKTDRAAIQFGDLRTKLESDYQKLFDELAFLRERIVTLERRSAQSAQVGESGAELPEDKKKLREPENLAHLEPLRAAEPSSTALSSLAEPAEAPKGSLLQGLKKTRDAFFSRLTGIFAERPQLDDRAFEELEELLITSDLGVQTTQKLLEKLRARVKAGEVTDAAGCRDFLKESVRQILGTAFQGEIRPEKQNGLPLVILVVGVNGVGKTTTIGKLAGRFSAQGAKVLLGAADTFRAAAAEQIEVWAERANVEVYSGGENAKPSTVAYEALRRARAENFDVVIIDTAGRLHTRVNLMNELGSVISLIEREQPGAPHETLLVVDATTGQNALEQAREFHQRAKLTGVIVTKLDGTAKGGIVVAIRDELSVPIRYVGVGESAADLKAFSSTEFAEALFAEGSEPSFSPSQGKSEVRAVRRRSNS
ncbi:MAG: signal recognition particle-docking protein FtsY [Bdellovibrionota bacterium]